MRTDIHSGQERERLLTGRIQKRKTNPSVTHIRLATHGRSTHWVTNVDFGQSDTRPSTPESDHTADTERGRRRGQKRTRVLQQALLTCVLGAYTQLFPSAESYAANSGFING